MVVGVNLRNVSAYGFRGWRGFILGARGRVDTSLKLGPLLQVTHSFVAKVLITRDGLGKHQRPICRGASLTLLGRTGHGHCKVVGILARLAPDGTVLRRVPPAVQGQLAAKRGRTYEIHFSSTRPLFLSESDQVPLKRPGLC